MKKFSQNLLTEFRSYTQNRTPDFDNILKVLSRQKPERNTLFEFFLNDELEAWVTGVPTVPGSEGNISRRIEAFRLFGYDYVTMHACDFSFKPTSANARKKETISINDANVIFDRDSFLQYTWPNVEECDFSRLERFGRELPGNMKIIAYGPGGVLENVIDLVGYDNLCYITSYPPRAYRFAASKNASMTTKFCSFDSGKCGGIAPLLK